MHLWHNPINIAITSFNLQGMSNLSTNWPNLVVGGDFVVVYRFDFLVYPTGKLLINHHLFFNTQIHKVGSSIKLNATKSPTPIYTCTW